MIIRAEKNRNYSVIKNTCLKDSNLSARSKGIFAYIMTLPDDWKLYKSELYNHFSEGKKAIDTAFKELETAGYIHKQREKNKEGRFDGWKYTLYEEPTETPISDQSETRKAENRPVGKESLINTDQPSTKEQSTKNKTDQMAYAIGNKLLTLYKHQTKLAYAKTTHQMKAIVKKTIPGWLTDEGYKNIDSFYANYCNASWWRQNQNCDISTFLKHINKFARPIVEKATSQNFGSSDDWSNEEGMI
jgi:hypothetical protein